MNSKKFLIEFKPAIVKDFSSIPVEDQKRIILKIRSLENGLNRNVRKLVDSNAEYRLRVGQYRVLFTIESDRIIIDRILHRKDAYRKGSKPWSN